MCLVQYLYHDSCCCYCLLCPIYWAVDDDGDYVVCYDDDVNSACWNLMDLGWENGGLMFCTLAQGNLQGKGYNFIKQGSALEYMPNQTLHFKLQLFFSSVLKGLFISQHTLQQTTAH